MLASESRDGLQKQYLGSKVTSTGNIDEEGRARVDAAWMKWKMATGALCDKKVPVRLKSKIYTTFVRPVALYGCATLKDKVSKYTLHAPSSVIPLTEKMKEARLNSLATSRGEKNSVAKTALKLDVSDSRPRRTPKIRWLDHVKLDIIDARLCTADAMDRTK
ncbi:hypothetical protein RB195_019179 [Necator americanus]|uniref:Uncharacterized protein n=1 Tax=Necator americanus TaxID=51031 RepID=A0ABR1CF87_NECAM